MELFWQFTAYAVKVIHSARVDYIRGMEYQNRKFPLTAHYDEERVEISFYNIDEYFQESPDSLEYAFEEQRIVGIIRDLPLLKKQVLYFLFVQDLSPEEVAKRMNCSQKWVYNTKTRLISKLRKEFVGSGGENHDE